MNQDMNKNWDEELKYSRSYLRGSTIENLDFETLFNKYEPKKDDFWYLDPPYIVATEKGSYYMNNFTIEDHTRLRNCVNIIDKNGGLFMISYDHRPEIKKLYNTVIFPVIMNLKWQYNRPRPHQLAPKFGVEINYIITPSTDTPSYPSGHTAYAVTLASVLSEMYPDHSSELYELVNVAGKARQMQGVHYESDNDASMVIVGALWQDVRYSNLLEKL